MFGESLSSSPQIAEKKVTGRLSPSCPNEEEYKEVGEQRDFLLVFQQGTDIAAETSALLSATLLITGTEISRLSTLTTLPPLKVPQ